MKSSCVDDRTEPTPQALFRDDSLSDDDARALVDLLFALHLDVRHPAVAHGQGNVQVARIFVPIADVALLEVKPRQLDGLLASRVRVKRQEPPDLKASVFPRVRRVVLRAHLKKARYIPRWIDGEGAEKRIIEAIVELHEGDRVWVTWYADNSTRIEEIEIVQ